MSRCGEFWVWDPRMDASEGGLLRDYSVYGLARRKLSDGRNFNKTTFSFTAFSFQEVNCVHFADTLDRDCGDYVDKWNGLTVIIGKNDAKTTTAITFRYREAFSYIDDNDKDFDNPLGFINKQTNVDDIIQLDPKDDKVLIWPNFKYDIVAKMGAKYFKFDYDGVQSVLFNGQRLFIAIRGNGKYDEVHKLQSKYYCIIHVSMVRILHNRKEWPSQTGKRLDWSPPYCFAGLMVGMFYDEHKGETYIVGRIIHGNTDDQLFNDQIYKVSATDGMPLTTVLEKNEQKKPYAQTLRSKYGCKLTDKEIEDGKTRAKNRDIIGGQIRAEKQKAELANTNGNNPRSKRSTTASDDTDDWIQYYGHWLVDQYEQDFYRCTILSVMAIILTIIILHYSLVIRSHMKRLRQK